MWWRSLLGWKYANISATRMNCLLVSVFESQIRCCHLPSWQFFLFFSLFFYYFSHDMWVRRLFFKLVSSHVFCKKELTSLLWKCKEPYFCFLNQLCILHSARFLDLLGFLTTLFGSLISNVDLRILLDVPFPLVFLYSIYKLTFLLYSLSGIWIMIICLECKALQKK